jgi:integrase
LFTRTRYQTGSLKRIARSKKNQDVWEFRYYETGTEGERRRRAVTVGTIHEYPSEAAARRSPVVQSILLRVNSEQPQVVTEPASFGALLARYEREEMPERYSTRTAYQSNINNHIRPRWGGRASTGDQARRGRRLA